MSAKGVRAGQAYVEIGADDSDLERVLKRDINKLHSFSQSVMGMATTIAGIGLAASAAFVPSIMAASEFEQTVAKFDTVFEELSEGNKKWAEVVRLTFQRSRQEIYSFLADSQTLLLPIGFKPGEAEEMSRQLTKLAFDMGSFHNKADADVMRDFHAALTGSGEVMKKYGVIVSEASVKQELLNKGMKADTASELEKVWARYNIIIRGTSKAHGDTQRSASTFDNQMKALKASIADLSVTLGTHLLPLVTPVVNQISTIVIASADWLETNKWLVQTIAQIGPGLLATAAHVGAVALALRVLTEALNVVRLGLGSVAKAQALFLALQGPKGWAQLALGMAAAAGAVYVVDSAMKSVDKSMTVAKDRLAAVAKETEKLQQAAKPKGNGHLGSELAGSFEKSLTPAMKLSRELEKLRQQRELWSKDGKLDNMFARLADQAIESATGIQDAMKKAREEIAVFSGQMTESEAELQRMAANGAPADMIEQYRQLAQARDAAKKAKEKRETEQDDFRSESKRLVESNRTKAEEQAYEKDRLQKMRTTIDPKTGKAFLDEQTYQRALRKLDTVTKPEAYKVQEQTRAIAQGNDLRSAEGARDLAAVFGGGDPALKAQETAAREAIKHTTFLKKIAADRDRDRWETARLS